METLIHFDQRLFEFLNSTLTHPWLDVFFPLITDLYKSLYFKITVYPAVLVIWVMKYGKKGALVFLFCVSCIAFSDVFSRHVVKENVKRLRPGDNPAVTSVIRAPYGGTSFTSNHATNMFAFATFVSAFLPAVRFILFAMAFLIAYSRIYVGVHFPADVICGALLGALIASLFVQMTLRILKIPRPFKTKVAAKGTT